MTTTTCVFKLRDTAGISCCIECIKLSLYKTLPSNNFTVYIFYLKKTNIHMKIKKKKKLTKL